MEQWKDIKGFEDFYQISNYGRIRSKDRIVKANKNGTSMLYLKFMCKLYR